jgi:hypothetical protein
MKHLIYPLAFMGIFILNACTQENEIIKQDQQIESACQANILFSEAQNLILSNPKNEDKIKSFFNRDWGICSTTKSRSLSSFEDKYQNYLEKHNITDNELCNYLEENPFELIPFVQEVSSQNFSKYYELLLSIPNIDSLITEIYNDINLTSVEKSMLILLMSSEINPETPMARSIWSCIKRHTKLTTIAVKATAMSFLDIQASVEYSERELKNMGSEYDC